MIIDCHCHLTEDKFKDDLDDVVSKAIAEGVEKIVVPATSLTDSRAVVELVKKYKNIYGLVGVHPENLSEVTDLESTKKELRELIKQSDKIVGIGEIGMDFYWDKEKKREKDQIDIFKAQLELALELDLPVAIHSRQSGPEIMAVFESMEKLPGGQFHCFGEDEAFLEYVLDKGFYVSFCGNITFKSAENLRNLAKKVPLERLLLETDSPYLSPEPLRGTRNEPKNVKITAEFLAKLRNISFEELAQETTKNAERLFGITL